MKVDVAIVGAGLVGGSLAAALSGSGLAVALLDQAAPAEPATGWDSRIYTVAPSSIAFLRSIGVWQLLDPARITPIHRMRIFGDDGRSELDFSSYESGVAELAVTAESGRLAHAIWRRLEGDRNLKVLCPSHPVRLEQGRDDVQIELGPGEHLRARLCVGADGANSWVRRAAGFEVSSQSYGERGVIANFACERAHRGTAFQWFRDDGVLAWLPVEERIVSIVWSAPDAHAQALLALSATEFCDTVALAGAGMLGALKPVSAPASFPLGRLQAERIAQRRVALLGDAAHVVHPLAGQGVNLGFGDAQALAGLLRRLPAHGDPGDASVLRGFERERAEDILAMRWVTGGLHWLFGAKHPAAARLRNLGLNLTNRVPVVKTLLARRAMGSGDTMKDIP
jgi:ubiquinone biosynthesis UbiH/UbiF/VisC/COQ6 family hydroxylase